jgi:hypothetical protein
LNSIEKSKGRPWCGLYVIKVGFGKACWDRETSANGVDIHGDFRKDGQSPYAGVRDWQILKCWEAVVPNQDEKLFRPWAKKHILWVEPGVFDTTCCKRFDLYCLSQEQVVMESWRPAGDKQNDDIVETAIKGLRLRIEAGLIAGLSDFRR